MLEQCLEVTAEGYAPVRVPRVKADGQRADGVAAPDIVWNVWLGRGATVRGRVVDAESGKPVGRARVVLWSEEELTGLTLTSGDGIVNPATFAAVGDETTADDGTFTLARVPAWGVHLPGQRSIAASKRRLGRLAVVAPGFAIETRELNVPDEGEIVEIEVRVTLAGAVRGRVVRAGGVPVPGVRMAWRHKGANWMWTWIPPVFPGLEPARCVSDRDGRYLVPAVSALREPARGIEVLAAPPGASRWAKSSSVEVVPRAGETVEAPDLALDSDDLEHGLSAMATVVDDVGAPVAGATFEDCLPGARTDESGRARLSFEPSTLREATVGVRAPGRKRVTSPKIALAPGTVPEVRVILGPRRPPTSAPMTAPPAAVATEPRGYALEGTIRDARTGRPILRWDVSVHDSGSLRYRASPAGPGRFRFESVPAGDWAFDARAEGYEPEKRTGLRVGPDPPSASLDVRLSVGVAVRGRVLDASGTPLGGTHVFFNGQGVPSLDGDVAPDGRFSVRGFRADGRYAVWVTGTDDRGGSTYGVPTPFEDLHVAPDASTVDHDFIVRSAGFLILIVRSAALGDISAVSTEGQVAAGAATKFTFEDAAKTTVWKSVGIWQRQRSAVLPVGRWTVRVEIPGSPARDVEFVIEAGKSTTAVVDVP